MCGWAILEEKDIIIQKERAILRVISNDGAGARTEEKNILEALHYQDFCAVEAVNNLHLHPRQVG
jgi:hypothetical protein